MTTKKLVIIIVSIVVVLGLLVVGFVGATVGFIFYSIGNSDAAVAAKTFLKNNERLKQDIGEVKDFGSIVTGNINVQNSEGVATLSLKVIGEKRTVNANVELVYHNGRPWRVTAASYKSESGQTIELLNVYDSRGQIPDPRFMCFNVKAQIPDRRLQI
jgi:Cytochrome oxidase complex assembly protein 1